jgi:hypothetical protein
MVHMVYMVYNCVYYCMLYVYIHDTYDIRSTVLQEEVLVVFGGVEVLDCARSDVAD